jgi:hypothetical protein
MTGRTRLLLPLLAALLLTGCGDGGTAASKASPEVVVLSAPARTFEAVTAQVEAAARDAQSEGRVRFSGVDERLALSGTGAAKGYPELEQPLATVDLVRGATTVESYGGAAVRGASTFRYEIVVDTRQALLATPAPRQPSLRSFVERLGAPLFYADVWIDEEGRLRRIQLPVKKTTRRPVRREMPELVTVDLFDFRP